MDKTMETQLKARINTTLPTCDDRGVSVTDDDQGHGDSQRPSDMGNPHVLSTNADAIGCHR